MPSRVKPMVQSIIVKTQVRLDAQESHALGLSTLFEHNVFQEQPYGMSDGPGRLLGKGKPRT